MAKKVFVMAIGTIPNPYEHPIEAKRTVDFIKKLKGLVGIHPKPPEFTLLCFDSLGHAVAARNMLTEYTIQPGSVSNYIMNGEISDDHKNLTVLDVAKDCIK